MGQAKVTKGYNLPAKAVIHTVGPVWQGGDKKEAALLTSCYLESLKLAVTNGFKAVAFPSVSTGVYGYPKEQAAQIAVQTVTDLVAQDASLGSSPGNGNGGHAVILSRTLGGRPRRLAGT